MAIDLNPLLQKAFFTEQVVNATEAIERARDHYIDRMQTGATSFELVPPPEPDETWVRERLLRPLVYYCESEGKPIPRCGGVFVSLFIGDRLYCVTVPDLIDWAHDRLGVTIEELRQEYGTHELDTALR